MLQDAIDIYKTVPRTKGMSVHVLTAPIYFEVGRRAICSKCVSITSNCVCRMAWQLGPTSGVLPGLLSAPAPKIIKFDTKGNVALFSATSRSRSPRSSASCRSRLPVMCCYSVRDPPWRWGDNIDFHKLVAGASLYLPVFNTGAQFNRRPACRQADGEVNGTAIKRR